MKKLFAIALFAAVGMSACSKDSDVTSPEDTKTYVQVTVINGGEHFLSLDGLARAGKISVLAPARGV